MDSSSPLSSLAASEPASPPSPSSPLSHFSRTPSLPSSPTQDIDASKRYLSPMSSTTSGTQSPIKLGDPISSQVPNKGNRQKHPSPSSDLPPAKKRKTAAPKERTTAHLDLLKRDDELTHEDQFHLKRLMTALHKKKKIVVIAGAGISVSAGIPDFRSSTGLFASTKNQTKLKASGKHLFDASVYKHEDSTQSFHTMVREMAEMTKNTKPTPFHHLLASLAQEGRLLRLYSQNIDCIDTSMTPLATKVPLNQKGPWPTTIQLHGGLEKMACTKCANLSPFDGNLFDGPHPPLCSACKIDDEVRTSHAGKRSHGIGRLRPRFVLYNEFNPDEEAIGNVSSADLKARPDAVIVVGTTLKVPGTRRLVKELCQVTRGRKDGFTAWINIDSEPKGVDFKDCWDLVVRSKCDSVAQLAALPPWDCDIGDDYLVSQDKDSEGQDRKTKATLEVTIRSASSTCSDSDAKPKQVEAIQTFPTPRASPKISATKSAKTKQSKLPFRKTPEHQTFVKVTKPRARKPNQPPRTKLPAGKTLAPAFKAVKNVAPQEKLVKETGRPDSADVHAGKSLPPLRPERRGSSDTFVYKREPSEGNENSSDIPLTPTQPKALPKGMENLIETQ